MVDKSFASVRHALDGCVNAHNLERRDRPKMRYEYYVTGRSEFPFDMLRHDSAWPARGDDASKLGWQPYTTRSIKLRSYRAPTVDRWSSFGWSVGFAAVRDVDR